MDHTYSITREHRSPGIHVHLAGEFDLSAREELRETLLDAVGRSPSGVVVDLGGVTFIDSEAINAVLEGFVAAGEDGTTFRLSNVRGVVRRVFEVIAVPGLSLDAESGS